MVIVGYGKFSDRDILSEICEIYVAPTHRNSKNFKKLLKKASSYLEYPWGFQVLESNNYAQSLFEYSLTRYAINYTKKLSRDGMTTVYKYRVVQEHTT
ncbi:hypothetical protein H1P_2660004 [Hyella patelloides LEGE 07179]|uniref:Uncharacterized protein n=1 Tax=Hyella patelloides LEGE 07179 TaxID=945734 RepID=A0A563VSR1_9CYAN|nr:hypothetical protein H1P_2660004 [Hyella patelloides LEGE 07179]